MCIRDRCYYQNSRFEDGIALLDRFVPDESHTLDYHNLKGRIYLTVNEDEKALEHLVLWLHAIQKLRPDGTKKTTRQMARLGYAYYTIASAKADMILDGKEGSLSEVMNDIEKAVAAEKDVSDVYKRQLLDSACDISRENLLLYAERYNVCPYELSFEAAVWSDCIICDYNYVFDPHVNRKSLIEGSLRQNIYLIDEAHNLLDRARDMYLSLIHI